MMARSPQDICIWLSNAAGVSAQKSGLSADSRSIDAGDVFLAYPGGRMDGRNYIADAIAKGAAAVLYDEDRFLWNEEWAVPHLAVSNLKALAGQIASHFYHAPDADIFTVAVTGTNGKTSSALWIARALASQGQPAALIGTLGAALLDGVNGDFKETGNTTPDAVLLQRTLAQMRQAGARALAIEASSIGLHQERLNGMHFDVALFTNLTRDHLDYHGDMESYEAAKIRLFDWPRLQHAIVNLDDPMGGRLIQRLQDRRPEVSLWGYTLATAASQPAVPGVSVLRARNIHTRHVGTDFFLESPFGEAHIKTRLVGHFNVSNVLGVLGVLLARGDPLNMAAGMIETLVPAPGRMQQMGGPDAPMVVIDYAHTPDALEQTLRALRQLANERGGRLWCVFGCGGERDPGKRPQMGAVSEIADDVVVTSDNPRGENPLEIIRQILLGMKSNPQSIEDRAAAILLAVRRAEKNDVVLLAGKGHEDYQEIKGKKLPFSDADHAALALAARASMKKAS